MPTKIEGAATPSPAGDAAGAPNPELWQLAQERLAQGDLAQARALLEAILQAQPEHLDTLNLLAMIAYRSGDLARGVELLDRAIAIEPGNASFHSNRGILLQSAGRLEEAIGSYDRAVACQPDFAEAHVNRAVACHALGRYAQAIGSCDRALAARTDYPEAYFQRGVARQQSGQADAALADYERAIALRPNYADAHFQRGALLHERNRLEAAIASYDQAIAAFADHAPAHAYRGLALHALDQIEPAIASYDRAIALNPADAMAHYNRGTLMQRLQRHAEAVASYDRVIAVQPGHAQAHYNRGIALKELQRLPEALQSFDLAVAGMREHAEAHNNRGSVLQELQRLEEALASFDQAVALNPGYTEAHTNRGIVLQELGRMEAAIASYDAALARTPEHAQTRWNRSIAYLTTGDFARGWPEYESRWEHKSLNYVRKPVAQPLWLGREALAGKTILLHSEQGLGDTIQFCRYARAVANLGATVLLEVQEPLAGLLAGLDGVTQVLVQGSALPAFDFHCPLLSLPLALRTRSDNVPLAGGYLRANEVRSALWRKRLGGQLGGHLAGPSGVGTDLRRALRVGLVWSGSTGHKNDRNRSVALDEFVRALPEGLDYVSLQKEVRDADQAVLALRPDIRHFGATLEDFQDTAALCALMDVVVSVDTSVVHLSGALGRPTWLLLPCNADWRWLRDRDDSPWYASLRLYRQERRGQWRDALERIGADLRALALARESG